MRLVRHILALGLLCALAAPIGGCSTVKTIQEGWGAITGATVSPKAIIVAANAFNAAEATATNYLKLPRCAPATRPICREPSATKVIIPAVRSGRVARDELVTFVKEHPGQMGPTAPFDVLKSSTATLQRVLDIYRTK